MSKNNGSANNSGAPPLLEHLRAGFLEALGGQDLRESGFENEEPSAEFGEKEGPWFD